MAGVAVVVREEEEKVVGVRVGMERGVGWEVKVGA
jgi:hypothetical protein